MPHKRIFTKEFMARHDPRKNPGILKAPTTKNGKNTRGGEATHIDTLGNQGGKALVLRISYGGTMTWKVMFYVKTTSAKGKAVTAARVKRLGHFPAMSIDEAYDKAETYDPKKGAASYVAGTFGEAAEKWLDENQHLRSIGEVERHLRSYVLPQWGERPIHEVRRREIIDLLDQIKKKRIKSPITERLIGGVSQADAVLATIRSVMMFHAVNDDDYDLPITPRLKLKRDKRTSEEKSRKRVLNDHEIRALWDATGKMGNRGALVRLLLLTAQRLRKVANMKRGEVVDGLWVIPKEPREKGNAGTVRLPQMALDEIVAQPSVSGDDRVFPASRSYSGLKRDLDALMPPDTPHWVLHDLRRTARTRMADLGIDDKIAELTLGHKIKGIEAVYNRADYIAKKSEALQTLATEVGYIIEPESRPTNVVPIERERAKAFG
jgi:integrase